MRYFVTIGTQTIDVDVEATRVSLGGEGFEVHLAAIPGTPLYHLLLAGESWTVAAQPREGIGRWTSASWASASTWRWWTSGPGQTVLGRLARRVPETHDVDSGLTKQACGHAGEAGPGAGIEHLDGDAWRVLAGHRERPPPGPTAVGTAGHERGEDEAQRETSAFQKSTVSCARGQPERTTHSMRRRATSRRTASRSWGTRSASLRRSSTAKARPGSRKSAR